MCDIALIKHIANKKKPIIISTGTQTLNDIETVNRYVKKYRIKDYSFLYCVSKYPSQLEDFNLNNKSCIGKVTKVFNGKNLKIIFINK